jgi:hypothetical protein
VFTRVKPVGGGVADAGAASGADGQKARAAMTTAITPTTARMIISFRFSVPSFNQTLILR